MLFGNTIILPEGVCWHPDEPASRTGPAVRGEPVFSEKVKGKRNESGRNRSAGCCDHMDFTLLYRAAV